MNRFDEAAKQWDSKSKRVEIAKNIVHNIKENISLKNKTILDYGCGTGLLAYGISDDAKKVIGMDSSHGMLKAFKEKNTILNFTNVTSEFHDANDMDLGKNRFDVIVSSMTLHHIKDTQNFINHCYESLKHKGFLAIADLDQEDGNFHSHGNDGVEHLGFSFETIKQIYQNAGFEIKFLQNIHHVKKEQKEYPIFLAIGYKNR